MPGASKKVTRRKRKADTYSVALPTERSNAATDVRDFTTLIYGMEKIGKSSMFSHADDVVYLATEPGLKALSVYEIVIRSWPEFEDAVTLLQTQPHDFTVAVVDTVDLAYKFCLEAVCRQKGIEHPGDEEYGKGWAAVRDAFERALVQLNATMGVVYLSHEKEKKMDRRSGGSVSRVVPSLANQGRAVLEPMVDVIGYYHFDGMQNRNLQIEGDDLIVAGCRAEHAFERITDGVIPMGSSPEEAYHNFLAAFRNQPLKGGASKKKVTSKKKAVVRKRK